MKIIKEKTIDKAYKTLIDTLIDKAKDVGDTYEINNCCLVISQPSLKNLHFPYRKISEKYSKEELKWYWSADNSCKTIGEHAKLWLSITDDGKTSNSAYGYIIHKKYDFDQLQQIIRLLKIDPTSRRAVINISEPSIDRISTKDMQCTIAIQFLIRNDRLEETVYMRSNDVYFGLPYDYIYFVSLGQYVAKQLDVKLSKYTHHATSMHMYKKDVEKFVEHDKILNIDVETIIDENYHKGNAQKIKLKEM